MPERKAHRGWALLLALC